MSPRMPLPSSRALTEKSGHASRQSQTLTWWVRTSSLSLTSTVALSWTLKLAVELLADSGITIDRTHLRQTDLTGNSRSNLLAPCLPMFRCSSRIQRPRYYQKGPRYPNKSSGNASGWHTIIEHFGGLSFRPSHLRVRTAWNLFIQRLQSPLEDTSWSPSPPMAPIPTKMALCTRRKTWDRVSQGEGSKSSNACQWTEVYDVEEQDPTLYNSSWKHSTR